MEKVLLLLAPDYAIIILIMIIITRQMLWCYCEFKRTLRALYNVKKRIHDSVMPKYRQPLQFSVRYMFERRS